MDLSFVDAYVNSKSRNVVVFIVGPTLSYHSDIGGQTPNDNCSMPGGTLFNDNPMYLFLSSLVGTPMGGPSYEGTGGPV